VRPVERSWARRVASEALSGLGKREHGVDVLTFDAKGPADLRDRERAAVDPVADRLSGHLELVGDLGHG
jgi:hypothetical protein